MKKTNILFLLLTTFTIILAGCSKIPDCTQLDTAYTKYSLNEQTNKCEISKEIPKNECGNGVAEKDNDENYCNCKKDVPKTHPTLGCEGKKGDYLEYTCSAQNTCELMQNEKVVDQTKSVEFKNSDLSFQADFTIKTPFILDTIDENKIKLDLKYFKPSTSSTVNIQNIMVKEVILQNSKKIKMSSNTYDETVTSPGQFLRAKEFEMAKITKYKNKENLQAELIVSYTKQVLDSKGEVIRTENKIETLKALLGQWEIINPTFEE